MGLLDNLKFQPDSNPEIGQEIEPEFAQDPIPGEPRPAKRAAKKAAAPAAGRRGAATGSTAKLAREVAEDLASLLQGTAAVWGLTDQCCAPVLEQQAKPIADALVGILARNPRLLAKFADTDIAVFTVQSIALGRALLPVGKAVYTNHVSKAVDDDEHEGHHDDGAIHLNRFPALAFSGAGTRPRADAS